MNENLEKVNENTPKDEEQNVVRDRSEKLVVEYRKPSIFMSLLLILIGVCLATIVLLLVYIFKIKPQNEAKPTTSTEQTEVVEEPEKEETKVPDVDLSIEGEFVKGLENKIPYDMYELKNYIDNKVDQSTVTNTEKLFYVFMLLKDENKDTFKQLSLFDQDDTKTTTKNKNNRSELDKALVNLRRKYGKNSVLRGIDLLDKATTKDRNNQIGGHHA